MASEGSRVGSVAAAARSVRLPGRGLALAGDAYGDPARPPVLLLHGGGQTRRSWQRAGEALATSGRYAVAADLRGHGESDWAPADAYGLDDFAADVETLCAALPSAPVIVGASLGGLATITAVGEAPTPLARAVILVDVAPRIEAAGAERVLSFMRRGTEGFASVDDAARAVGGYLPDRPRPARSTGLRHNLRQAHDGRWYWHWDPAFLTSRYAADGSVQPWEEDRLAAAARRLGVPTLLVRGGTSDVVSDRSVEELRALVPHAEVAHIAGAGHMVAGDRNDAFNEAVLAFIDRLDRSGC